MNLGADVLYHPWAAALFYRQKGSQKTIALPEAKQRQLTIEYIHEHPHCSLREMAEYFSQKYDAPDRNWQKYLATQLWNISQMPHPPIKRLGVRRHYKYVGVKYET